MAISAVVEGDGRIIVEAIATREIGLRPGDKVQVEKVADHLVVIRERDMHDVFERWRGFDTHHRAPRSMEEIIAEQREMRGHDDLD